MHRSKFGVEIVATQVVTPSILIDSDVTSPYSFQYERLSRKRGKLLIMRHSHKPLQKSGAKSKEKKSRDYIAFQKNTIIILSYHFSFLHFCNVSMSIAFQYTFNTQLTKQILKFLIIKKRSKEHPLFLSIIHQV